MNIYLFSKCDIFIGIHGAAIANLYFMKPGSRIIQILAYDCKPHYFDRKANNRKIKHDFLHLKDFKHSEDVHCYPRDSYMTIHDKDIKQLNYLLDQ